MAFSGYFEYKDAIRGRTKECIQSERDFPRAPLLTRCASLAVSLLSADVKETGDDKRHAARDGGAKRAMVSRFGLATLRSQSYRFSSSYRRLTRSQNQVSFPKSPFHRQRMEHEVDGWIAQLSQCKQLSEADVKTLCDRVRIPTSTPRKRGLILSSSSSIPLHVPSSVFRPEKS